MASAEREHGRADEIANKLEKVVAAVRISPEDARKVVNSYRRRYGLPPSSLGDDSFEESVRRGISEEELEQLDMIAKALVRRYATLSATAGGVAAIPSVIPGVGPIASIGGGTVVDMAASLKLQMDLAQCLITLYHPTMSATEQMQLSSLLGVGGAATALVDKKAAGAAVKVGAKLIEVYLKGATLAAVKQFFRRLGITFVRSAFVKAIPLISIPISAGSNYALTLFTGSVVRSAARPRATHHEPGSGAGSVI